MRAWSDIGLQCKQPSYSPTSVVAPGISSFDQGDKRDSMNQTTIPAVTVLEQRGCDETQVRLVQPLLLRERGKRCSAGHEGLLHPAGAFDAAATLVEANKRNLPTASHL